MIEGDADVDACRGCVGAGQVVLPGLDRIGVKEVMAHGLI